MITEQLLDALARAESRGDPRARSPRGAEGLYQFMPATSRWLGINPWDPVSARAGAEKYLQYLMGRFGGDLPTALAAWNWGEGNVRKAMKQHGGWNLGLAPQETRDFVPRVLGGVPGARPQARPQWSPPGREVTTPTFQMQKRPQKPRSGVREARRGALPPLDPTNAWLHLVLSALA
jgi:hypothetical protein